MQSLSTKTRYVLNGILFSFKDNKLTLVATDGHRLALVDLEVEFPSSQETEIIVKLIFTKSNIDIVANTPEVGEAKESLAVMYQGREFSIAFNPEFLMAPLRNLSEEEIYLDLIDELR